MTYDPPTWLEAQADAIEDALAVGDHAEAERLKGQAAQRLRAAGKRPGAPPAPSQLQRAWQRAWAPGPRARRAPNDPEEAQSG